MCPEQTRRLNSYYALIVCVPIILAISGCTNPAPRPEAAINVTLKLPVVQQVLKGVDNSSTNVSQALEYGALSNYNYTYVTLLDENRRTLIKVRTIGGSETPAVSEVKVYEAGAESIVRGKYGLESKVSGTIGVPFAGEPFWRVVGAGRVFFIEQRPRGESTGARVYDENELSSNLISWSQKEVDNAKRKGWDTSLADEYLKVALLAKEQGRLDNLLNASTEISSLRMDYSGRSVVPCERVTPELEVVRSIAERASVVREVLTSLGELRNSSAYLGIAATDGGWNLFWKSPNGYVKVKVHTEAFHTLGLDCMYPEEVSVITFRDGNYSKSTVSIGYDYEQFPLSEGEFKLNNGSFVLRISNLHIPIATDSWGVKHNDSRNASWDLEVSNGQRVFKTAVKMSDDCGLRAVGAARYLVCDFDQDGAYDVSVRSDNFGSLHVSYLKIRQPNEF